MSDMPVYEYQLMTGDDLSDIERRINRYSREGWRVVGVVASTGCMPVWTMERVISSAQKDAAA